MSCEDVFERVSAALDGELPAEEQPTVSAHLTSCAGCTSRHRVLEQTRAAYRTMIQSDVHPAAARAFDDEVLRRVRSRPRAGWWLTAAAGIAAVMGALFVRPSWDTVRPREAAPLNAASVPGLMEGHLTTPATGIDCGAPQAAGCIIDAPCIDALCGQDRGARTVLARPNLTLAAAY